MESGKLHVGRSYLVSCTWASRVMLTCSSSVTQSATRNPFGSTVELRNLRLAILSDRHSAVNSFIISYTSNDTSINTCFAGQSFGPPTRINMPSQSPASHRRPRSFYSLLFIGDGEECWKNEFDD